MTPLRPALAALAILTALGTAMPTARAQGDTSQPRTVTISATGTVTATPDMVMITTGVQTEAESARDALTRNTADMQKVIDALKAAGLESRDIQTTNFSVQPRYEYFQDGKPPVITGYQVMNMVNIRLRDIGRLGAILDQLVSLGSNQISGIQFDVSNGEELKDGARTRAMDNARRMATLYATAAGASLGEVLRIEEGVIHSYPRPMMAERAAMADGAPVPIEAGEQSLQVQVTVVWALK